ncbi:MAG TPA: ribosomal protein S18-alanine N-acetyltransferase [Rhodocyclaceae bacterium]|nr:ribosomal protein S18-alanine N-acetyltransferase [Rhodocyclaceae bacterium]
MTDSSHIASLAATHNVTFTPMRLEDLDWLAASESEIYPFPWHRGNFADSLTAGHSGWLVHYDGVRSGYAIVMTVLDEAHILNVNILPSVQRRGLGTLMLDKLRTVAREAGATQMFLEVRRSNEVAQALYYRWGFRPVGVRKNYYPAADGREDAVVMACKL